MTKLTSIDTLPAKQEQYDPLRIPFKAEIETFGLAEQMEAVRAMCADSGRGHTKFAATLICLLDVTAQLAQVDEDSRQAEVHTQAYEESSKWHQKAISNLKFAKECLVDQQVRVLTELEDLSFGGASILKDVEGQSSDTLCAAAMGKMSTLCGLSGPASFSAPPGLSVPPQSFPEPAPGLSRATLLSMRSHALTGEPESNLKTVAAASIQGSCSRTEQGKVAVNKKEVMAVNQKFAAVMASVNDESDFESTCSMPNSVISDAYDSD